jgi:predicted ATPase
MKIVIQCGDPTKLIWASPTTFYFPERYYLHPKLHIKFVEDLLKDVMVNEKFHKDMFQNDVVYIITNSEHIINRFRVAKKQKEIKELEIQFSPFNENKSIIIIKTDFKGEFNEYPIDFMDEWSNQLMKLI